MGAGASRTAVAAASATTRAITGRPQGRPRPRGLIISFDALGTLYRLRKPVGEQYLSVAQQCHAFHKLREEADEVREVAANDLDTSFRIAFKTVSARYPNYGLGELDSPEEWWREVVDQTFRAVGLDDSTNEVEWRTNVLPELSTALYRHFSSQAAYELYADVRPFLQRMHAIRARLEHERSAHDAVLVLGVITNSDPRARAVLESMGLGVGVAAPPPPQPGNAQERWRRATEAVRSEQEAPAGGAGGAGAGSFPIATPLRHVWSAQGHDFDFIATGYEARAEKPAPAIFNRAALLARLNLVSRIEQRYGRRYESEHGHARPFREAVGFLRDVFVHRRDVETMAWIHVGDDYARDYQAARDVGIDAFHLVRDHDSSAAAAPPSHTISSLIELVPIVNILVEQNMFSSKR